MALKHSFHYLNITDEIRERSLYVLGGGMTSVPAGQSYPPVDHPQHHFFRWSDGRVLSEFQLVYITRGGGTLESRSGGVRSVVAGDLFMLFPNEWHRYVPSSAAGWNEHWVAFKGGRMQQLLRELGITPAEPVFRTDITDLLEREFVRIEEELGGEASGYQSIVTARIELILSLAVAAKFRSGQGGADAFEIIKRAKTLIVEQIESPLNMEEVAKELKVGYSWFRKTFRAFTGVSPGEYQLQIRIAQAREFLRGSNLPVTIIGARCGFESAYYFSRIFKKKTGLSPTEYRSKSQSV